MNVHDRYEKLEVFRSQSQQNRQVYDFLIQNFASLNVPQGIYNDICMICIRDLTSITIGIKDALDEFKKDPSNKEINEINTNIVIDNSEKYIKEHYRLNQIRFIELKKRMSPEDKLN